MSKETIVCILGVLVFLLPFMGLPRTYKEWILIVVGLLLVIIGYSLRRLAFLHSIQDRNGEKRADVFVESGSVRVEEGVRVAAQERHI